MKSFSGQCLRGRQKCKSPWQLFRFSRKICPVQSYLVDAKNLAGIRSRHSASLQPLFRDTYASHLLSGDETSRSQQEELVTAAITAALDAKVLEALDLVNVNRNQEFNQVVLIGCGLDTRPQRLLWPAGTVIFEVAQAEVHAFGKTQLALATARVPRGSLLRRVSYDLEGGKLLSEALHSAGYRGNRMSVWLLQGLNKEISSRQLRDILTQISMAASFDSLLLLECPLADRSLLEALLAEHKMQGTIISASDLDILQSAKPPENLAPDNWHPPWLAFCQHKQLSISETEVLRAHSLASEDTDEDFMDNFS